jgi:hypothetical protein
MGGHQDRRVENTVLLGADELLALEEQQPGVAPVVDYEIRDGAGFADFLDRRSPTRQGFVGQAINDVAGRFAEEWEYTQPVMAERLPDAKCRQ